MKTIRKTTLGVLCLLLAAATAPARADVSCWGNVLDHLVYDEGILMIRGSWRNDWTYLCNVQMPWRTVSTESCFAWLGMLLSAEALNRQVRIVYAGDTDCSALGTYGASPTPVFIHVTG